MLEVIQRNFIPNKVVLLQQVEVKTPKIDQLAPVSSYVASPQGGVMVYVCHDFSCKLPTEDPDKLLELLNNK